MSCMRPLWKSSLKRKPVPGIRKNERTPSGVLFLCARLQSFELLEAFGTDVFPLEQCDVLGAVAENAAGLILFQNDRGTLHIDFQCILLRDVQCPPHLDGQNDTTQLIYLSDNSRGFHNRTPFFLPAFPAPSFELRHTLSQAVSSCQ